MRTYHIPVIYVAFKCADYNFIKLIRISKLLTVPRKLLHVTTSVFPDDWLLQFLDIDDVHEVDTNIHRPSNEI